MKIENLTKALHSSQFMTREIRDAHSDAVGSGNQFAEIVLFDLIKSAAQLEQKLKQLVNAADSKS